MRKPDTYMPQPRSFELGKPRPTSGRIPFKGHRTVAEIDAYSDRFRERQIEHYRNKKALASDDN